MNFLILFLLIFIGFTNARLYKRWQYGKSLTYNNITDYEEMINAMAQMRVPELEI
jgi:hypothetical protein